MRFEALIAPYNAAYDCGANATAMQHRQAQSIARSGNKNWPTYSEKRILHFEIQFQGATVHAIYHQRCGPVPS